MNIKLKADKFVNNKKFKLNYIKPKDLKLLLAEFCDEQNADLEKENAEAKEIIREYYNLKNFPCASGNSINMLMYENINHKAEAFLKE